MSRVAAHNSGTAAKYTRSRLPVELVYYEACESKSEAMSREWHIKKMSRPQKAKLVAQNGCKGTDVEDRKEALRRKQQKSEG